MIGEQVSIHKYKFSDWTPSSVRSIAVDGFSGVVAVGRADGEIEILSPGELWCTLARISGKEGFELKSLQFSPIESEAGRLFGASLNGFLFEVDFTALSLKNVRDSYGGSVWSIACCPRKPIVALGCEDKTVKIFSYDSGPLEYDKSFHTTGSRVLCVAFDPVQPRVLAGCADGTIRCYDEVSGRNLFRLTGDNWRGASMSNCIWTILVLNDKNSTIVSGDSQGKVQFWDGKSGDLFCSIHQHSAPVQCIAVSEDQDTIFASGVDSRVICLQRIVHRNRETTSDDIEPSSVSDRWIYTSAHRPHSHDVFSLAVTSPKSTGHISSIRSSRPSALFPGNHKNDAILVSGGQDCKICMYSVLDFAGCRPNCILPVPFTGVASAALDSCASSNDMSGVISIKHKDYIDIWRIRTDNVPPCEKCCQVKLSSAPDNEENAGEALGRDHIHSVEISPTGEFVAISGGAVDSDARGLRILRVVNKAEKVAVEKVKLSAEVQSKTNARFVSCQSLCFSSDGKSLAVVTTSLSGSFGSRSNVSILLLDLAKASRDSSSEVSLHFALNHTDTISSDLKAPQDDYASTAPQSLFVRLAMSIKSVTFSADDRWLAVASSSNKLYIYEIDRSSLHWTLPAFPAAITSASFHPASPNSLVVTTASTSAPFLIYDVQDKQMSTWSLENTTAIPNWSSAVGVQNIGPIQKVAFDPSCESAFTLFGQGFSLFVDLNKPILTKMSPESDDTPKCKYIHNGQVSLLCQVDSKGDSAEDTKAKRKKRKSMEATGGDIVETTAAHNKYSKNFSVNKAYRSLVYAKMLGKDQVLVIENPWVRILESLPATLSRKRFGT